MQEQFVNTHQILQEAATETKSESKPLETQTFKLSGEQKARIKEICESNGTTVSKFFQKCTEALIREYDS